jgi:hypothetical protein
MQTITFTPQAPVTGAVSACAGVVEFVEGGRHDCVLPDCHRIFRVRSTKTGTECWAYLSELTVESVA